MVDVMIDNGWVLNLKFGILNFKPICARQTIIIIHLAPQKKNKPAFKASFLCYLNSVSSKANFIILKTLPSKSLIGI